MDMAPPAMLIGHRTTSIGITLITCAGGGCSKTLLRGGFVETLSSQRPTLPRESCRDWNEDEQGVAVERDEGGEVHGAAPVL